MDAFFRWLADWYLPDPYLCAGRIQGITWTLIDVVIVASVLRLSGAARGRVPRVRWALLALTALAVPVIAIVPGEREFFLLEAGVCGTQFAILLWTVIAERVAMAELLARLRHRTM